MTARLHRAAVLLHDLDVMLSKDFQAVDPLVAHAALRGSAHVQGVLAAFEQIALREAEVREHVASMTAA